MLNHAYGSLECEEGDTRKRGISRENIGLGAFCTILELTLRQYCKAAKIQMWTEPKYRRQSFP